jgi:hypothetical protein
MNLRMFHWKISLLSVRETVLERRDNFRVHVFLRHRT